jgi:hypothetical protein
MGGPDRFPGGIGSPAWTPKAIRIRVAIADRDTFVVPRFLSRGSGEDETAGRCRAACNAAHDIPCLRDDRHENAPSSMNEGAWRCWEVPRRSPYPSAAILQMITPEFFHNSAPGYLFCRRPTRILITGPDGVLVCGCRVSEDTRDLVLRQQPVIVHRKRKVLADRQDGLAGLYPDMFRPERARIGPDVLQDPCHTGPIRSNVRDEPFFLDGDGPEGSHADVDPTRTSRPSTLTQSEVWKSDAGHDLAGTSSASRNRTEESRRAPNTSVCRRLARPAAVPVFPSRQPALPSAPETRMIMSIKTTALFLRPYRLPRFDGALPAGEHKVETPLPPHPGLGRTRVMQADGVVEADRRDLHAPRADGRDRWARSCAGWGHDRPVPGGQARAHRDGGHPQ